MILFNNEMYTVSVSEIAGLFYNQQCRFIQFKPLGKLLDHIIIAYTLKWFVYFRVVLLRHKTCNSTSFFSNMLS